MVKGAWWHSAHFRFSFQVRLSFARKARPRFIVPFTSGVVSAASAAEGSIIRVRAAVRRHTADLLGKLARAEKEQAAGGQGMIVPGRHEAHQGQRVRRSPERER